MCNTQCLCLLSADSCGQLVFFHRLICQTPLKWFSVCWWIDWVQVCRPHDPVHVVFFNTQKPLWNSPGLSLHMLTQLSFVTSAFLFHFSVAIHCSRKQNAAFQHFICSYLSAHLRLQPQNKHPSVLSTSCDFCAVTNPIAWSYCLPAVGNETKNLHSCILLITSSDSLKRKRQEIFVYSAFVSSLEKKLLIIFIIGIHGNIFKYLSITERHPVETGSSFLHINVTFPQLGSSSAPFTSAHFSAHTHSM